MTSYREMAARGRAEARERTAGRRKVRAERIEYGPVIEGPYRIRDVRLIGSCGHTLRWLAGWPASSEQAPPYLTAKLGRKMTCEHDDCRVPAKPVVPDAERCEYVEGIDYDRRCRTRARYETDMGRVCRKHRDWYLREGYIDEEGTLRS